MSINTNRIARNTIFLYIRMFFVLIISFYCSRIVLKALGETDFGIYNVVGGLVAMMSVITSSMALSYQRYMNVYLGKNDYQGYYNIFSNALTIQLLLGGIVLVVGETLGLWFLNSQMTIPADRLIAANVIYQTTLLIFITNLFISPLSAVLISHEEMTYYAILSIVQALFRLGFVLLLYYVITSDKLIAYGVGLLIIDVIVFILNVICAKRVDRDLRFRPKYEKQLFKSMVGFSGWGLFGSLAFTMKGHGLNIVLNLFFNPAINAARGIAYQVSGAVESMYQNFQVAVRPQIMKSYSQGNHEEMNQLVYFMSKISFLLLWIVSLPVLFLTDPILTIWLGDYPDYTTIFTQLVIVTSLVGSFGNPLCTIVHATGRMRKFQIITSSVLILIVPIAYFVLKFGAPPQSALVVSLVITFLVQVVRLLMVNKMVYFPISRYLKLVIIPCVLVVIVSSLPTYLITIVSDNQWYVCMVSILTGVGTIVFLGLSKNERNKVKEIIGHYLPFNRK